MKTEEKLTASEYLDDGRWGIINERNEIVVRISAGLTRELAEKIVRAVNSHDALVEALEKVQRDISDGATLVDAAATYCNRHNTSEALVGVLELRRVVETALALAKEGKDSASQT